FQWGQPGDVGYFSPQTAEPEGLSADAAWGLNRGKTPVINPAGELTGQVDLGGLPGVVKPRGMALTVAAIPQLAGGLRDDRMMLMVSFWRDFHPARELHDTSELLGWMINDIAKQELIDLRSWHTLDAAAREKEIARISAWARDRSGRSEADLLL